MKKYLICFCFILSFFYLMIASKCSFLYAINDWVDANAFFTMGKGMAHGLVPFRDLFEQKGPLLYFFHLIGYLISNTSFFGIYLFEVVFFAFFLYYAQKIAHLYVSKEKSILILPILAAILLIHPSFRMGDSAEEFVLPMLTYSLYVFLAHLKGVKKLTYQDFFVNGFLAGCVLWIKYTMIGFWFAWMMFLFFDSWKEKNWKKTILICFAFLFGMFVATIPWICYFGYHGALDDLVRVYFLINKNAYSHHASFFGNLFRPFQVFYHNLKQYPITFWILLMGLFFLFKEKSKKGCLVLGLFVFLIFTVYIGGFGYRYYFFIFLLFLIFGLIFLVNLFSCSFLKRKLLLFLLVVFGFFSILKWNSNTVDLGKKKEEYPQYVFAEEILKEKNPTLLNYGFIDGGFYLKAHIVPNVYYFEKLNFKYENYPENMDEQNRYIKEKLVQFIVLKTNVKNDSNRLDAPYLYDGYHAILEFPVGKQKYVLFKQN